MANDLFSIDFSGNKPLVQAKRAMFESLRYMFWGKFMKFNTADGKAVTPNGAVRPETTMNSPIVVQREFADRSKPVNEMWIPTFRQLVNKPKLGKEALTGLEEERYINFARVYIEQLRHGEVVKQGRLETHLLSQYGIPESSKTALAMHYARWMNFAEVPTAFYKGISYNVLNSGRYSANTKVATVSHPNFYCVGSGRVAHTTAPGNAGYETAVATALAGIGPAHKLSASVLAGLNTYDDVRRIPYLYTKDGKPFRILVVHPYGMADLRKDADIKALNTAAFVGNMAKENPMLNGMELFYEGFAIFDGGNAVWPISSDGSTITYGPSTLTNLDSFNDFSSYNVFGAMVLGDNALYHGIGWDMEWTGETRDHKQVEAVGYTIGNGLARADFWNEDDGTTGQYLINTSSAVLAHYVTTPSI